MCPNGSCHEINPGGNQMAIADIAASPEAQAFAASLAARYGITPAAAQGAIGSLLPALAGGLEHSTLTAEGIAQLMETMAQGHHQNVIDNPALVGHPDTLADGNAIIGQLTGGAGLSSSTLQAVANQAGVPAPLMNGIAPAIAVFLIGYLFRHSGGLLGNVIGAAMGGGGGMAFPQVPQMPPMGRPASGGGMMPPMPDLRTITQANNPYGSIANSIRNGGAAGGAMAGGVRDVLGSLLGFGSSKGILGWIIRLLVLRYGMSIVRGLLRSFLPRL